jgi:hypothetical protein
MGLLFRRRMFDDDLFNTTTIEIALQAWMDKRLRSVQCPSLIKGMRFRTMTAIQTLH